MKKCYDLVFDGKEEKRQEDFHRIPKNEFNNIIITVKDKLSIYEKHTITHTHTQTSLCLERTTDKIRVKEFSFLI